MDHPAISVGTPKEYAYWLNHLGKVWAQLGLPSDNLQQIDARYNYEVNRVTLYHLRDPSDDLSVAETISHEYLHALLDQEGEGPAARQLDLVAKAARSSERIGGI
ncbi:MAG: hypothetical protein L3J92_02675 [Thermoplasmata archaeon]|nr:hypothetical protein [Thermoplasmata archaeon]